MDQSFIKYLSRFIRTKIEGRHILQKAIINTGWLFADKIIRIGVGLLVGVWVARYLGPEQFGIYNYSIAFVALFSAFATLGLDGIVVRDIVHNPADKDKTLGTSFVLRLIGGIVTLLLAFCTISLIRPGNILIHWLVAIVAASMIFQAFDVIDFWFQSQVRSKYTVYAKNTAFLLVSIATVLLILLKAPIIAFAFIILGEFVIGAVGMIVVYRVNGHFLKEWRVCLMRGKELLNDSWPLILSGIAVMIYMRIDQIMLGEMIGDREVGIYSAAVRLSEAWYFVPTIVSASVYPILVKNYHESKAKYYDRLKTIMGYFFWGTLVLSIVITSFSEQIIYLLYGGSYLDAAQVLSIHIYSGIIVSMSIIFSQKFVIDGTTKISFYGTITGVVSNVILNLWLIKPYGAKGAAMATVLSYICPLLMQTFLFDKRIGLTYVESIFYILKKRNAF